MLMTITQLDPVDIILVVSSIRDIGNYTEEVLLVVCWVLCIGCQPLWQGYEACY